MLVYRWRRVEWPPRDLSGPPPVQVVRIGMARWLPESRVVTRKRKHLQLALVTRGSAWFERNGHRHEVPRDAVMVQQRGARCAHGTGSGGVLHKRWIELTGPGLAGWLRALGLSERGVVEPARPAAVRACLRAIQATATRKPAGYRSELCLQACRLLLLLDQSARLPHELERLQALIDRGQGWTVAELAALCDCHPRRLQRLCREHLGCSPQALLRERRLERARQLLQDSDLPMAAIAEELGFADQFTFAHHIRRHLGCSPTAWRTAHRE